MSVITANRDTLFQIRRFSGLNESPSGDAGLKWGEGARVSNFRVTPEGNLQIRPGTKTLWRFDGPVEGIWEGTVGGNAVRLAAAAGELWRLGMAGEAESLGKIGPGRCFFFPFSEKVYLLTGKRYMVWTGYGQVTDVEGYRPVVAVAIPPEGGGTLLEQANKLTGARRGFFSPDGVGKEYRLPEKNLTAVDYVLRRDTGKRLDFAADRAEGTVTLREVLPQGTNTLEIGWTHGAGQREAVVKMARAELYSGQTDNRVFLYGDGTNKAVYSGVDYDGRPSAEYFPDLNVLDAGNASTPITGILRHFSRLLVFKPDGAFSVQSGTATPQDGAVIPAFYVTPIQREMGCDALGQATLVDNDPRTVWAGGVYRWSSGSGYLTLDERVAKRISQRCEASLEEMDLSQAVVFDDQRRREWYLCSPQGTLVHNYAADAWYRYEGILGRCFGTLGGEVYFGTEDGRLCRMSREYRNDDGKPIEALWRSGSMDMDRATRRKYGKWLWISMKPESGAAVTATTRSDRRSGYPAEVVRAGLMNYRNANFGHWSYATNRQPKVRRVRLRLKKAAYEQILLQSQSASETATILALEGKIRYGG